MDSSKDPRCQYIANVASTLFNAPGLIQGIVVSAEVTQFLNEISCKTLQILSDGNKFKCYAGVVASPPEQAPLEVHFVKVAEGSQEIEASKIQTQLMVSSMRNSSVHSLHAYLANIYAPVLFGQSEQDKNSKTDTQLRDLLYSLRAGLQKTIRKGGNTLVPTDFKQDEFRGILSPLDEIECWQENERENIGSSQNESLRKKAELINKAFSKIAGPLQDLDILELGQINSLVDNIQDALDQIWRSPDIHPAYPQPRMEHLFKVITKTLGARIEKEFKQNDIWQASFSDVRVKLNECMRICRGWKDRVTEVTREFWKGQSEKHQWQGKPFYDSYLENIIIRISSIFELRSQHDELLRLLTQEERDRFKVASTFDPFRKINSFYTNEYQAATWSRAIKEYERILEPMEKEICQKLRKEIFAEGKASPSQLLREFQRWKGLLSKESIKKELQQERENVLQQLIDEIPKSREEFEARTGQSLEQIPGMEKPPQSNNVSDTVGGIIWSRQLSQKLQSSLKVAQGIFGDIPAMGNMQNESTDLCKQIKSFEDGLFSQWVERVKKALSDKNEQHKYQMTGQLMEFDIEVTGLLKVNYSEKLVTLVKDARVLGEHGFKIPKPVNDVTENAKKFYKEGVTLKQVANFYNSLGDQMINCQKPMMLEKLQQFEYLIKNPKGKGSEGKQVTWNDPIEIENYIKQVQIRATDLIAENRKLRKVHLNMTDMIIELMNIDLLKHRTVWKENLTKMRRIIETITKTRPAENCKLWLTHLNFQLYKALEFQYQMGLESLNESLPEIQTDLVFRNQTVEFRPDFEELKKRYYTEISIFITIPLKFQGVGGKTEMFSLMPDQNSKHLKTVYEKAEELFSRLEGAVVEYLPWTALGNIDIQSYIEANFTTVQDWEDNFQMLRQKRKELKKLPDSFKVDCININIVPFKAGIEELFRKLTDALVETLQESIERDAENVRSFIKKGLEKLSKNPKSVEEIELMNKHAMEIGVEKGSIVKIFQGCELKNKMIKQMTGTAMRGMGEIESMWREFDARLAAFQDKIEEQKAKLMQELDISVKQLNSDLEKMFDKWNEKKPKERNQLTYDEAMETSEMMRDLRAQWQVLQERVSKVTKQCENFGKSKPTLTFFDKMKDELEESNQTWGLFEEFKKEMDVFAKEEWLTFRKKGYFAFQDFFLNQADKMKVLPKNVVVKFLMKLIEDYKQAWPLIKLCTGESFEKEHWRRLITLLAMPKEVTFDNMKFGNLIDSVPAMLLKSKDIKDLADKAQGEVTIREAINELRTWCESTDFILSDYESNGRTTPLIREWKEVITQVSDHQSLIISLKESRYFASFADQIEQFEKRFGGIDDYLAKLNIIQRKWVYLEPIFMRGALPQEQGRFKRVDEEYRSIALGIGTDPKVMSLCEIPGLKDTLETIVTQLDMCQKALNDYLEEKRAKFSRFYFIGDDDLLEILGQAQNPVVIQSHLKKLFSGIYKVEFNKENTQIKSMISSQGEYVPLVQPVQISIDVEVWLGELEKVMRLTLDKLLKQTIQGGGLDIVNLPSQICCLGEMINFSVNCVKAIQAGKLQNYKQDLQKQLESYTQFDNKNDNLLFSKVKALILDIIHNISVVDDLLGDGIVDTKQPNDWMWFKQLRYAIDPKGVCKVGMCDAFFDYTFEYQGNAPKLVHTPLTDKCYLTLVMGMKLGYGGNPYGPAGTGKTESVKALGQAFGRQVLVFNCDEGLDYKAMGRIFIGLVKCGAWGCFDEFNRLLEEQLSAISQQIQVIQWAIKENQPSLELLGRNIPVNKNAGIFVTLNPAGKGYGGRSKLPDNLKQLFRPVAMSAPDLELIAETMLFSEGFKHAKKLSIKLVSLFKLCNQLLSTQQHYDWKLRAQKTILGTGGSLIQQELKKGRKLSYEDEALILIKSIRVNTISKLTYADAFKYEALQTDMFPGIKSEDIAYEQLTAAINKTIAENKLQQIEKQVQKILQFQEATKQRMGVVIVGPSGCGKTTIWKTLKQAYEKMGRQIVTHVMNPKSMPREQLLGQMNHDTREFHDGVLTASARLVVKEPQDTLCWIVCDGDIDPEWIESLNSVMDDNHLLTLPNGERISFGDNVNFIFETNDLRFASPATVSRLGMIFLSEEDVDVKRITNTWVNKQPEASRNKLSLWIEEILTPCLDWVLQRQELMIEQTTKVGTVNNCLAYLAGCETKGHFAYAVILGFGGNFKYELRKEFIQFVIQVSNEKLADSKNLLMNSYDIKKQQWFSFVDAPQGGLKIDDLKNPDEPPIILTSTIQRDLALVKPLLEKDESFILVGPEGCGKNLVIRSLIKQMKSTQLAVIHCNAQTAAFHVIQKLNQMCSQSTNSQGRVYRPKECQRLIIYLKDINLPKPDKYDTIQLISFLQQIVCYKGFYDDNLDFVSLERVSIVASMNPSTTLGRHKISTRFTANVRLCYMDYPSAEELLPVYSEIMKTILSHQRFGNGAMANSSKRLSTFLIDLFAQVKQKFSVDEHRHYLFTPRELTAMIFQMLRYEIPEAQALIEVLIYESNRVFRDRLVDRESKRKFDSILYTLLKNHLKYQEQLKDTYFVSVVMKGTPSLIPGLCSMGRIGKNDFVQMVEGQMRAYEREFKELEIHMIDEVLDIISQVERVLSMPGGSLLLAGRSGVCRKQATQIIAHMLNLEFITPNINRDYSMKEFKRDLKVVLQKAGIEATRTVLFIEDHQLIKDEFLELLNSLISAGEVPGLYTPEELEPLLSQLKDEMSNQYECRTLFEFFVSRVKKNLSVVVSLDNKHRKFPQRCSQNPSLFTKCIILWLETFTKESLVAVAQKELGTAVELLGKSADEIINSAVYLHTQSSSLFTVSPLTFVNFVKTFKQVLTSVIQKSGGTTKHLISGLEKLQEAQIAVDKLSKEANEKKKKLGAAQKEASVSMQKIQVSMEQKAERKQEVEKLQKACAKDQTAIETRKSDVEQELSGVQPEVDAARAAVGQLKPANLNEIKGFRQPPPAVEHVLSAVMVFLGQSDISWNAMKSFLSNSGVITQILGFDARQVTPKIKKQVQQIVSQNASSFEQAVIYNASRAAAPLAAWSIANIKFSEVLLKIEPLTSELDGLTQKFNASQARVQECQVQLQQLSEQTDKLNNDFQKKTMEAARLEADLNSAELTLNAAQKLLLQLSGENERWRTQVQEIEREMALVPQRALISGAYLTYLGGANETVRESTLKEWLSGTKMQQYSFKNFMSTEQEMLTWKKEGLPADSLSIENGIIILNTARTPLIIDPATQASEWLKRSLKKVNDNVEILNHQDAKFNNILELSIRFGKVLIIQEVDGIESLLVPVLRRDLIQQGPRQVVQIGEKTVDFNPAFRLYLTTRDQFVEIQPNVNALITVANFTVTKSGLEGQLLSITINFEQPELEARKTQILEEEERLKIQLADFEKQLLTELANSSGNILENKTLIDSLNMTKTQSSQIEKSLAESKNLQISLDQQREVYRNFAFIGSNLFMVFGDLIKLNTMYQFSLSSFIKLFNKALNLKPQAANTEQKLQMLSNSLIRICFSEIARSLFKADRLTYSMHFVKGVFPGQFQKNEWEFFNGLAIAEATTSVRLPKWVSQDRQEKFAMFQNTFAMLAQQLQLDNDGLWKEFSTSEQAEKCFPQQLAKNITPFQKCLLVQVFRPDRLESAMHQFVKESFGNETLQPVSFALKNLFENESNCKEPIMFIISPGSDPSAELQTFAEQVVGRSGYHELAMGGGQNEIAIETIKQAATKGEWVCLKNLHLVTPWLSILEKEFKMLTPNSKFRLWLTSEPHTKFPSILLQSSLKITYETPPGVRNNMTRTLQYVMPAQVDSPVQAQVLFILSWFHALIQERRTYIPQGWVKYYEFSYGDLKAGEQILSSIVAETKGQSPQWQKIYGILENAIYGGRVDNEFDMRVLRTYMKQIFQDSILKGQQQLSGMLTTPQSTQSKDYLAAIQKVPEIDNPEIFGLPANIDRSVQRFNSNQVINELKSLAAASAQELRFDKDKWTEQLGPICQLWQNIFKAETYKQIKVTERDLTTPDPVDQFVYMEMIAVKDLLTRVNDHITSISKVLQGQAMLTPAIQSIATELLKGSLPVIWEKLWDGPQNPSSWIRLVNKKGVSLCNWVQRVQSGGLLKQPVNLSDLFHPETFLNAFRQRSARLYKVAIDELKIVSSFEASKLGKDGVIQLEGLYLQGCAFDGIRLADIQGSQVEIIQLPVCQVAWIAEKQAEPYPENQSVETPVYFGIDREKLLCTFKMANNGNNGNRIISGVALLLNGTD